MRVTIFFLCLILTSSISAQVPRAALQGKSGTYDMQTNIYDKLARGKIRALLYIPSGVDFKKRPLIVFFHGATGSMNYYSKNVEFYKKRARTYKFSLLSMQNAYGYARTSSRETGDAIEHSINASAEIISSLIKKRAIRDDATYATGFSAGGYVALLAAIKKPDIYAGFGSFKGNFYDPGFFYGETSMNAGIGAGIYLGDEYEPGMTRLKKSVKNHLAYICIGGVKDAKRVQSQAPEAKMFLETYFSGMKIVYKKFPNEGHTFTQADWTPFWKLVEQRL